MTMKSAAATLMMFSLTSSASGQSSPTKQATVRLSKEHSAMPAVPRNKGKAPLVNRMLCSNEKLIPVVAEQVRGMTEALKMLRRPGCATVVGGSKAAYVRVRLVTAEYYTFAAIKISAEEHLGGDIQTAFAVSYVEARRVLLFPAFQTPERVLMRQYAGGTLRIDAIPKFERSHGFKPGSMSPKMLQALVLLHEHMHLNGTAIDEDYRCVMLSMLNTRRVAEACAPDIIDTPPTRMASLGSSKRLFVTLSIGATRRCQMCHTSQFIGSQR
jgi:hypothetical protein